MKKLMTMIAAAATAFGLYAADPIEDGGFITGASFEPNPAYTADSLSWTAADGFLQAYWSNLGDSHVTNLTYTYAMTVGYPFAFAMENHDQYMVVSTTLGNPVEHKIAALPKGIDKGIFFDSMVNMTIFDSSNDGEPTLPAGTKLAVYLQMADESESATNFVVCARDNAGLEHRFVCSPDSAMTKIIPGWHRITIRAIGNILDSDTETMSAFMVYVDGVAVSCTDAKITGATAANLAAVWASYNDMAQLFVSLDPTATELASVSFDGKGAVDDVVFTTTLPGFIQDPAKYTVAWDPTKVATLSIDGVLVSDEELAAGKAFRLSPDDPGNVAVVWTGKPGYCGGEWTASTVPGAKTDISDLIEDAKVELTVGDVTTGYEKLEDAVGDANKADANCTIKLLDQEEAYEAALTFKNANDVVITLDLNGCTIKCTDKSAFAAIDVAAGTKLVITDNSDGAAGVIQAFGYTGTVMAPGLALNVAGEDEEPGAVAAEVTVDAGTFNGGVNGDITISSEDPKFDFIDNGDEKGCWITCTMGEGLEGYVLAADDAEAPQYWVVTAPPVAKIDDVEYTSFAEAFAAANEAGDKTINILRDCSFNEALTNTAAMTIDIPQGMTLSWTGDKSIYPFVVKANLTLTSAGTIEKDTDSASLFILGTADVAGNDVKMTLNGPTLTTPASQIIKASYGDLDVLAGSIVNTNSANRSISVQFGSTATIKGGFIKGEIVNNRETDGNDGIIVIPTDTTARFDRPNGFAPEGYKFVIDSTILDATWYKIAEAISVTSIETDKTKVTGVKLGDCFAEGEEITFTVTADVGAELSGWAYVNGNSVKIGEAGACTYTVTWQDIRNEGEIKIEAKAKVPGPEPINPDESKDVTATDEEDAKSQVQVQRPAGIGDTIVTAEDYDKYFVKSATLIYEIPGVGGIYTVTATLDPEIIKAATATEATLAEVLKLTAAGNITLTADQVKPGLYYSLKQGEKLDVRMEGERKLATKDGVTLLAGKWTNSGFYQVLVNWKATDTEETQEEEK